MAIVSRVPIVEHSHDLEVHLSALHAETHIVHQSQGRVGGGGQGLVEECVDLLVFLAQDLRVIGICGHSLQAVGEDFDCRADVIVLVKGGNSVLLALLHQIGRGRPGGRAFGELRSGGAVLGLECRFIKISRLLLELSTLLDERLKPSRIEIHIGNGGKKAFEDKPVNGGILGPQSARLVGIEGKGFQAVKQVVLQSRHVRLLAAYS